MTPKNSNRRSEERIDTSLHYVCEILLPKLESSIQLEISDISMQGISLWVDAGSPFLNKIKVGRIIELTYFPKSLQKPAEFVKGEIKNISLSNDEAHQGQYHVGLKVLDRRPA